MGYIEKKMCYRLFCHSSVIFRIDTWIYGHSHTNIDTVIGNTKIISNQMGYIFENEHLINGFDAGKIIEL